MKKIIIYAFALIYAISLYLIYYSIPHETIEWLFFGILVLIYTAIFILSYYVVKFFIEIIENNFLENNSFSSVFYLMFIFIALSRNIGLLLSNLNVLPLDFTVFGIIYGVISLLLIMTISLYKIKMNLKWTVLLSIPMLIYLGFDLITIRQVWGQ